MRLDKLEIRARIETIQATVIAKFGSAPRRVMEIFGDLLVRFKWKIIK